MVFRQFYVTCGQCGHKNRPNNSPSKGVRLALLGELPDCKGCGQRLTVRLPYPGTAMVQRVRAALEAAGRLSPPAAS